MNQNEMLLLKLGEGEKIQVDTRTGEYLGRVKE